MTPPRPKVKFTPQNTPSGETKFYIDFSWWEESNRDLQTYIFSRLEIDEDVAFDTSKEVDLIDGQTGEVARVDGFQYMVRTYFQQLPEDFLTKSSLVDAVFCTLLANANQPMSLNDISERVARAPEVLLQSIGGPNIYQGIRPYTD